jgi:hypothetical protein
MNRITVCLAVASRGLRETLQKPGPLAPCVRADAPPDTIGVMLSWTPGQTIVDFRSIDQIFTTHTMHRGANVRPLQRAAVQIDPVVTQSKGLPAVGEQLDQTKNNSPDRLVSYTGGWLSQKVDYEEARPPLDPRRMSRLIRLRRDSGSRRTSRSGA